MQLRRTGARTDCTAKRRRLCCLASGSAAPAASCQPDEERHTLASHQPHHHLRHVLPLPGSSRVSGQSLARLQVKTLTTAFRIIMSDDRRYNEAEIASIFNQAAEAQEAARRKLSHSEGLTLTELQQIGHEAGITPEFIARAAASIERADATLRPRTYLGLPFTVARTVHLPGPFSERDWELLVGDLRETFQASGEIRRDGAFREWRNGNFHVHVEPTESGHRLRLHTRNDISRLGLTGGLILLIMGLIFMLTLALAGDFMVVLDKTLFVSMFAVLGFGGASVAAYRLPKWAKERARLMDEVAARTIERMGPEQMAKSLADSELGADLDLEVFIEPDETTRTRRPGSSRS